MAAVPRLEIGAEVTAIIPTKNRPFELARTVATLLAQTLPARQLVIVDQSAARAGHGLLRAIRGRGLELDYVYDPRLSGVAAARNRGMALARGAIWLFLDDDVELEADFLAELWSAYGLFPDAAGISGIVTNYAPSPWPYRLWSLIFRRGPLWDDRQPLYWRAERLRTSPPQRVRSLGGGLMSFRAAMIRGQQFDERQHGASPGEDVAFCRQLPPEACLYMAPRARLAHRHSANQREPRHWLGPEAEAAGFCHRVRPGGAGTRAAYVWFLAGCALAASAACARRGSLAPVRNWLAGLERAHAAYSA